MTLLEDVFASGLPEDRLRVGLSPAPPPVEAAVPLPLPDAAREEPARPPSDAPALALLLAESDPAPEPEPEPASALSALMTERRLMCSCQPTLLSSQSSEMCADDTDGLSLITLGPDKSNTSGSSAYSARCGPVTGQRRARGRGACTRHQCFWRVHCSNGCSDCLLTAADACRTRGGKVGVMWGAVSDSVVWPHSQKKMGQCQMP